MLCHEHPAARIAGRVAALVRRINLHEPHPDTLRFPPGNKNQNRYANWKILRYNYDNKIIDWRDK